ncbi:hypothetical protein C0J52_10200 [Blattella germanica]|nr:hypothetical protein C0J52_10200 [Blattella germanica]
MPRGKYSNECICMTSLLKLNLCPRHGDDFVSKFPKLVSTIWKLMRPFFMQLTEEERNAIYFQQDSASVHAAKAGLLREKLTVF